MKYFAVTCMGVVLLGAVGCTQLDDALLQQEVRQEVGIETNQVVSILPTGALFTNTWVTVSTNYFTNYVANPNAEAVIKATEFIPIYGGLISLIGTTLLGMYRSIRNRKIAEATVLGVEAGRRAILELENIRDAKDVDATFKRVMVETQKSLGEQAEIAKIVNRTTGPTNAPSNAQKA